jgi:cell division protein FtsI/penicillin-binding protein 2
VKPFLALAWGESHSNRYPEFVCSNCWLPQGHGRMDVSAALAHSCNSYFVQLAGLMDVDSIERTVSRFGLPMPSITSPEILIGRFGTWRATPLAAALAYHELAERRSDPGVPLVLAAMRECARSGTASGIGAAVAAKTGTAPCVHSGGAPGDGLLMALFPAQSPGYVLMIRAHGVPGAECARRSGPFLRAVVR